MKVTGYKLREAIKMWELRRDAALKQFDEDLTRFPSDPVEKSPTACWERFLDAETNICRLQTAQQQYNLKVTVTPAGKPMTLCQAVKMLGGLGRSEKMWKQVSSPKKERYSLREVRTSRQVGVEEVVPVISKHEAVKQAVQASRVANAYRSACNAGNAQELEVEGLDPALFE